MAPAVDEKTPLLGRSQENARSSSKASAAWLIARRAFEVVVGTVKIVLSAAFAPGRYVIGWFYDDGARFSLLAPIYKLPVPKRKRRTSSPMLHNGSDFSSGSQRRTQRRRSGVPPSQADETTNNSISGTSSDPTVNTDSEQDGDRTLTGEEGDRPAINTRCRKNASPTDKIAPAQRSIRIKLHSEEALRQRRPRRTNGDDKAAQPNQVPVEAAAALKSPTISGPSSKLTKFPRTPQPPRPLVPRRQPSFSATVHAMGPHQKTLIIDLDETLIHSMAKGGRYTNGHMVEVKLQQPMGASGAMIGPSVPILYYVHKRPHCDEFLKKVGYTSVHDASADMPQVCKWYNLIIFTASVQEYADPVIDWLEVERKYFSARYYRQHCTFRNGAYIKDLAQVEPDLSKVMIIDNSPMSYIFHEGTTCSGFYGGPSLQLLISAAQTTRYPLRVGSAILLTTISSILSRCSRACST